MKESKSLNNNPSILLHTLLVGCALTMFAVSLYLTKHYFDIKFPTDLAAASACNINQYFNCDAATHSHASNIFGVPISLFGLLFGAYLILSYLFKTDEVEGTNSFLSIVNAVGCLVLLTYSLFGLKSICPFCSIYYLSSFGVAYIYYKYSSLRRPSFKVLVVYAVLAAIPTISLAMISKDKSKVQNGLKESLIKQYESLENLGNPKIDSPYRLLSSSEKFTDAPVQISLFSDFQCPACKALGEQLHPLLARYKGKLNIQYFFYPLDMTCNSKMTSVMHAYACQAAYLASCLPQKFLEIHDQIFANQENLSTEWLQNLAKENDVLECMNTNETVDKVKSLVEVGNQFDVHSTPTMILNGVKIEGVLPTSQLQMLIDELIEKSEK